jgi:hypothetical protein
MDDKDESKARAARARAETLTPERRSEIASEAAKARWSEEAADVRTPDHFVVYQNPKGVKVDLRYAGKTMWATQRQMAEMFDVSVGTVSRHLKRIFAEGELQEDSVVALNAITASDGKTYETKVYDLNAIISVGYRVESRHGTFFRIWATDKLFQFLTKGFVMDDERLKNPDGRPDFFDELLERIRDIRSSEKRMWTRVLELGSFCTDFPTTSAEGKEHFCATIQNAMHWAVTQETAAEVIYHRVDASKDNAGVMRFAGESPTAEEAKVAKNYYAEKEIAALNVLTSATLEFFESQAEQRRPTTLAQFLEKIREFIKLDGRPLIPAGHLGKISMKLSKEKAALEIAIYKEKMRLEKEAIGERAVSDLLSQARAIASEKRAKRKARDPKRKS